MKPRSIGWLQVGRHAHTRSSRLHPGAKPCLLPLLTIALCLPSGVMGALAQQCGNHCGGGA